MISGNDLYENYRESLVNECYPLIFLDLNNFERNITEIKARLTQNKTIRIASKSVRSIPILKMIFKNDQKFMGLLSYSGREAVFLSQQGFKDILIAYPIVNLAEINCVAEEIKKGADITLMVDNPVQVKIADTVAREKNIVIPLCLDIDMSTKYLVLHFGVFRSPINDKKSSLELADCISTHSNVTLKGVMGYEAQIAGLPDRSPSNNFLLNIIIRKLKKHSIKRIRSRRKEIIIALKDSGYDIDFVNGGGTGSIESSSNEDVITEVTVGSGFYSSHLFDYYDQFRHSPALMYAIEITRIPKHGIYTCHGGGYVASGALGIDKIPKPYLPSGLKLLENEMAGEVQTPIKYKGKRILKIGDPIIMRHSKAGELCEHFNEILIIKNNRIVDRVKTYRGEGKVFL